MYFLEANAHQKYKCTVVYVNMKKILDTNTAVKQYYYYLKFYSTGKQVTTGKQQKKYQQHNLFHISVHELLCAIKVLFL